MLSLKDLDQIPFIFLITKKRSLFCKDLIQAIMIMVANIFLNLFLKNLYMKQDKKKNWKEFAKISKSFMDPKIKIKINKWESFQLKTMYLLLINLLITFLK